MKAARLLLRVPRRRRRGLAHRLATSAALLLPLAHGVARYCSGLPSQAWSGGRPRQSVPASLFNQNPVLALSFL